MVHYRENCIPESNKTRCFYRPSEGSIDNFIHNGSGWRVYTLQAIDLNIANYNLLNASSYLKLPKKHEQSKSILNIQNNDKKCFVWSILARHHPVDHGDNAHYVNHYLQYENELIVKDIKMPMKINDIPKVEEWNNLSIY